MAQEEGPGPLAVRALLTQDHRWLLALPSQSSHPCSCILTETQGCLSGHIASPVWLGAGRSQLLGPSQELDEGSL